MRTDIVIIVKFRQLKDTMERLGGNNLASKTSRNSVREYFIVLKGVYWMDGKSSWNMT